MSEIFFAKILAAYPAQTGKIFDAVYTGEMERQQKTAEEFLNHYRDNQLAVPRPQIDDTFNEYDSFAVWEALIPEMTAEQPALAAEDGSGRVGQRQSQLPSPQMRHHPAEQQAGSHRRHSGY